MVGISQQAFLSGELYGKMSCTYLNIATQKWCYYYCQLLSYQRFIVLFVSKLIGGWRILREGNMIMKDKRKWVFKYLFYEHCEMGFCVKVIKKKQCSDAPQCWRIRIVNVFSFFFFGKNVFLWTGIEQKMQVNVNVFNARHCFLVRGDSERCILASGERSYIHHQVQQQRLTRLTSGGLAHPRLVFSSPTSHLNHLRKPYF